MFNVHTMLYATLGISHALVMRDFGAPRVCSINPDVPAIGAGLRAHARLMLGEAVTTRVAKRDVLAIEGSYRKRGPLPRGDRYHYAWAAFVDSTVVLDYLNAYSGILQVVTDCAEGRGWYDGHDARWPARRATSAIAKQSKLNHLPTDSDYSGYFPFRDDEGNAIDGSSVEVFWHDGEECGACDGDGEGTVERVTRSGPTDFGGMLATPIHERVTVEFDCEVCDGNGGLVDGWYWWACQPGCLPDSDGFPAGGFDSARAAYLDAMNG